MNLLSDKTERGELILGALMLIAAGSFAMGYGLRGVADAPTVKVETCQRINYGPIRCKIEQRKL